MFERDPRRRALSPSRRTGLLAAALIAALAGTAAAPALAQEVIKIGAPLALTGGLADEGKKQDLVWKMWVEKVNAAGGLKVGDKTMKVELIEYDYQSEGQRASQLAEKLINDDKVQFLFAPFGSGHTKIVGGVGERYQVPTIACVASSESVFDQSLKHLFGTLSPNGGMTTAMVKMFKEKFPETKTIAVLGRDDVFPKSMAEGIAKAAEAQGLTVAYKELYPVGTMDHAAALSSIKAAKPDWIYITGYTQDLILARKQMQDLGVTAPIVTMVTGPSYKEFTEGLGKLADGVTSSSWWHHATNYTGQGVWPATADFYKDFQAKTGGADPDYVHGSCAAAGEVIADALARTGSLDKAKLRDAIAATDIQTFYGPIKFGPTGMNLTRELPIIQVQGETIKVLAPADIKNADLIAMPK
ncbi:amino acid ABC transporter substrate-binding protein [Ancylobacter defluvii]|uniref:Amino acid ABC transporter substrate-binding protein n=1 Tax=Ancylobacter defluvii TaxID=1282440 RepID=A0A9W6ND84_9HYPH|nr:amino acid ABC transporter substrate-binding protein [Ancylobacter defluvii]MBS7588063.1 amino acid ABC transporter substrate-binding protein [Ancylobacter defluvii]GLK86455.1 amino acid ABC transporter substrate-binding protein [Ancylobacter defluvii]